MGREQDAADRWGWLSPAPGEGPVVLGGALPAKKETPLGAQGISAG